MIKLNDSIITLNPSAADAKACNFYIDDDDLVIESILDYLLRIPRSVRVMGLPVTILKLTGQVDNTTTRILLEAVEADISNYSVFYYRFTDGVNDDDFKEWTVATDLSEYLKIADLPAYPNTLYTTDVPTTEEVHGIPKGSTYPDGIEIVTLIDRMLHKLQNAIISAFTTTQPLLVEVGTVVTGVKTFNWLLSNPLNADITKGTLHELEIGTVVKSGINLRSLTTTSNIDFPNTVPTKRRFVLRGTDIENKAIGDSNAITIQSVLPFYHGVVIDNAPNSAILLTLAKDSSLTGNKTYSYTPNGGKPCFASAAINGSVSMILDKNGFPAKATFTKTIIPHTVNGLSFNYEVWTYNDHTFVTNFNYTFIF